MWAIILQTSFVCCFTANAEQLLLHDQGLIQQGLDVGNTGATAETMGVDTHGRRRRRRRAQRRRRRAATRPFCSNDINGGDQMCSAGCWSQGTGCTGYCKYYSEPGNESSPQWCGCSCVQADPATVNIVAPVTAATVPEEMLLDDKLDIIPAFCIGGASDNLPFPTFLLKKMPASVKNIGVALVFCYGDVYGTAIGLTGEIPGWSITGHIYWTKSIFGFGKSCIFCADNPVDGKVMICRTIELANVSIDTFPTPGDFTTLIIKVGGKLCLGFGIEAEPLDTSKTNLFIEPAAGITFTASYFGNRIDADILMTGKISMKDFKMNPLGKFDGFSFQLGIWAALYYNNAKFAEVSIEISEEWELTVDGLDNFLEHPLDVAPPVKEVKKGMIAEFWDRINGNNLW